MTDWNRDGKYDYRDDAFYHEVIKGERTGGSNKKTSGRNAGIAWTGILIGLFGAALAKYLFLPGLIIALIGWWIMTQS